MSEETQTTEEKTQADNFAALRKEKEALEAQVAELTPLKVAQIVKEAGFDPDTPAGKALSRLATPDSDTEAVRNLAEELGFEAEGQSAAPTLTPEEQAFQASENRKSELQSVTTSDEPDTLDDQIAEATAALSAARAAKNWEEARAIGERLTRLNSQKMFNQTLRQAG